MARRFAKSIMDAAWNQLIHRLNCEAEKAGKWVVPVDPRGTTKNAVDAARKFQSESGNGNINAQTAAYLWDATITPR